MQLPLVAEAVLVDGDNDNDDDYIDDANHNHSDE